MGRITEEDVETVVTNDQLMRSELLCHEEQVVKTMKKGQWNETYRDRKVGTSPVGGVYQQLIRSARCVKASTQHFTHRQCNIFHYKMLDQ